VRVVSGRIVGGRIVLDEPLELPEGTTVEVVVPEDETIERVELELAIDEPLEPLAATA
jgi:hypothetical protein